MNSTKTAQANPLKVMIAGFFSLILTMGVARFSYTPLLPVMMDQTFLNNFSGGWLATINYIGYMSGALIAASISDLKLKDTLYRIGLIVAVLSTIGMALAENPTRAAVRDVWHWLLDFPLSETEVPALRPAKCPNRSKI